MNFYHLTQWDLSQAEINTEMYTTTNWKLSNYWKVHLTKKYITNDYFLESLKKFLDNIPQLKEFLIHGKYSSELLKEYIFENVRFERFSDLPSRKNCMFLFDKSVDPIEYSKTLNFNIKNYSLIEIQIDETKSKYHFADMKLLDCNSFLHDDIVNNAIQYWEGTDESNCFHEVLFEGFFTIKDIIKF